MKKHRFTRTLNQRVAAAHWHNAAQEAGYALGWANAFTTYGGDENERLWRIYDRRADAYTSGQFNAFVEGYLAGGDAGSAIASQRPQP